MSEDLEELRETFRHFDKDGNGTIDRDEFAALLKALGADCDAEEIEAGLTVLDTNNSGQIDFDEFAEWWSDR